MSPTWFAKGRLRERRRESKRAGILGGCLERRVSGLGFIRAGLGNQVLEQSSVLPEALGRRVPRARSPQLQTDQGSCRAFGPRAVPAGALALPFTKPTKPLNPKGSISWRPQALEKVEKAIQHRLPILVSPGPGWRRKVVVKREEIE